MSPHRYHHHHHQPSFVETLHRSGGNALQRPHTDTCMNGTGRWAGFVPILLRSARLHAGMTWHTFRSFALVGLQRTPEQTRLNCERDTARACWRFRCGYPRGRGHAQGVALLAHLCLFSKHSNQHVFAVPEGLEDRVEAVRFNTRTKDVAAIAGYAPCAPTSSADRAKCGKGWASLHSLLSVLPPRTLWMLLPGACASISHRTEDLEEALPTDQDVDPCDSSQGNQIGTSSETCLKPNPCQPSTRTPLQHTYYGYDNSTRADSFASTCLNEMRCCVTWLQTRTHLRIIPAAVHH